MNLEELNTFIKLCEVKNFTKTAEILLMSQPTVSLHIKNLEREFQTQLFQRSSKQLNITPTGELLLEKAKQMLQIYEQTKQAILEHQHTLTGELKIGASFTIGESILPSLLADLRNEYPELELNVIIGNTVEIVQYVKLFQVDIGLIEGKTDEKELLIHPFMKDELVIIAAKNNKLLKSNYVTIADLQNQSWISRENGSGTRENLNHFLRANGLRTKSMLTISSNQGIKETVIQGLGLSLLSKSVIKRDLKLGAIGVVKLKNQPLFRTLSYIYSPIMQDKRNVQIFIQALNNKWPNIFI